MASTKEYRDFILKQLVKVPDISFRPMMGEYLLYSNSILFGGIYDNRLLIKIVPTNAKFHLPITIPYPNAKSMYLVEDLDDKENLATIITATVSGLK